MKIIFYYTKSDNRKVDKTIHELKTIDNITIKENTTLYKPQIEIDYDSDLLTCNYLKLIDGDFKKFYFVNNVTVGTGQTMLFDCKVDVLMTYKKEITESEQLVTRQRSTSNDVRDESLVDDLLPLKASVQKTVYNFNGSPFTNVGASGRNIALTVTGG